jgi:quercetin dioxygenase-like cupin family protein
MSQAALLPNDDAKALSLRETTESTTAGIVSRTLLNTPDTRVTLFSFAAGQELTAHTNPRRALIQIVDGSCEFLFGGTWQTLKAGDLLHLPPSHPHAVKASAGPFVMLLTLIVPEKPSSQ